MSDTHTHATGEICPLPLTHPSCPFSRAARSSGQPLWRPGTKPSAHIQSWSGTGERSVLLHVFLVETLVNTGRTCKHRKAQEIAHLSTEGQGRTCPQYQQHPMQESNPGHMMFGSLSCFKMCCVVYSDVDVSSDLWKVMPDT